MAASAYRAGVELVDERTGQVHDYTRRSGVESAFMVLPGGATAERSAVWNAAEAAETRKDGRTAREWLLALPDELNPAERSQLAGAYAGFLAERYGVAVDVALHLPDKQGDQRNHHAHLLSTTRRVSIGADGAVMLGAKTDIERSDTDRKKAGLGRSADDITECRAKWAELANSHLEKAGHLARIDHRSLADQGVDREPTVHLGPTATEIERRGGESERGDINRDVHERNRQRFRLLAERETVTREIAAQIHHLDQVRQRKQMSAQDLRVEIARRTAALPDPQAVVAQLPDVAKHEDRLKRLEKIQAEEALAAVKATEAVYRWRVANPKLAWLHDKGLWPSPELKEESAKAAKAAATRDRAAENLSRLRPTLHALWGTEIGKVQAEQLPARNELASLKTELANKVEIEAKAEATRVAQARQVDAEVQPLIKDFVSLAHSSWRAKEAMPAGATRAMRDELKNYADAVRADKGDEHLEAMADRLRASPEARTALEKELATCQPAIEQERQTQQELREEKEERELAARLASRGPSMRR